MEKRKEGKKVLLAPSVLAPRRPQWQQSQGRALSIPCVPKHSSSGKLLQRLLGGGGWWKWQCTGGSSPAPPALLCVPIVSRKEQKPHGNDGRERRGFTRVKSSRKPVIKFQLIFMSGGTGLGDA